LITAESGPAALAAVKGRPTLDLLIADKPFTARGLLEAARMVMFGTINPPYQRLGAYENVPSTG